MDADDLKARKAIIAILDVADSNFPSNTDIVIQANGANCGSITLPAYQLRKLLKAK